MPEKVGFSRMKLVRRRDMPPPPVSQAPYVELGVTSPFSFLRGASDAIDLVLRALELGMHSIGIADRNTRSWTVVPRRTNCTRSSGAEIGVPG